MTKIKKMKACLLALGISVSLLSQLPVQAAEETAAEGTTASEISTNAIPGWPQGPEIPSAAAMIMEESTNTILYSKNADQALFPGGAVKIMTVLLALENSSLSDNVTMTATGVSGVTDGGANIAAQLDETFTMEQCLYAIMLASANDIALQVAEHVGGSVENFVAQMNARAAELGCTNTVFTNPTGLPDENQHITAHDMALIMKAAISNESFRTIAAAASYTIPATNVSGGERALTNNFAMMNTNSPTYYEGCLGGREGYTEASGSTLACGATRNGITLVAVVLKGAADQTPAEAVTLLDYGFANFQKLSLGNNDFNMLSGGTVIIPATASEADLEIQDTENNGQLDRQYLFGGNPVGTAVMSAVQEGTDPSLIAASEKNIQAAQNITLNKSMVPYYLIAAGGAIVLILLLVLMVKIIKS